MNIEKFYFVQNFCFISVVYSSFNSFIHSFIYSFMGADGDVVSVVAYQKKHCETNCDDMIYSA